MKKVTRLSIPLVVVLLLLTLSGASQARPLEENGGSPPNTMLLGDTGNGNTIVFSVPGNSYEVALQVARSWGFETLFVRNHESPNQEHATYFYDVGSGAFRVILTKRDGQYVNRPCGNTISIASTWRNKYFSVQCPW